MSKIIRQPHPNDDDERRLIEVRSFSFTQELSENSEPINLSAQAILDEQQRVRKELDLEVGSTRVELQQQRQAVEQEIQQMREAWAQEKEQLQKQAYEDGFAKGYEDGNEKIQANMSQVIDTTNATLEAAVVNADAYLQGQEQVILELAIESAKRIVGQRLTDDSTLFLDVVKRALVEARDAEFIKIYTSSLFYGYVTEQRKELEPLLPPNLLFTIFMDANLNGTECYIESNHGRMIVTIDEQLNELKKSLIEIMESEG